MKQVLLHIGMNKTGTTAIQAALKTYRDATTAVADFDIPNHSIPMSTLFRDSPETYTMHVQRGRSPEEVHALQAAYRDTLDRQIAEPGFDRLIISGEGMSTLAPSEKARMLAFFDARGCPVQVVCLVRDPVGFTTSVLQQHIKIGKAQFDPTMPEYQFRLDQFRQAVSEAGMLVRSYEAVIAEHGDAVSGFAHLVGLDPAKMTAKHLNTSLSATATKLLFRLNRSPRETFGSPERFRARGKLVTLLSQWFPVDAEDRLNPHVVAGLLAPEHVADLAYLSDTFGIDYPRPEAVFQPEAVERYLLQPERLDHDAFDDRSAAQGVPLSPGQALDDKLIALYDHLLAAEVQA